MRNMFEGYQNTEELTNNLADVGCLSKNSFASADRSRTGSL